MRENEKQMRKKNEKEREELKASRQKKKNFINEEDVLQCLVWGLL